MQEQQRTYIAIDQKSFYASVDCVDRGLDSNYIKHFNSESKSYHISAIFRNFAPRFYIGLLI